MKVYLVLWWECHECINVDSVWTKKELAEKRIRLLKSIKRKLSRWKWEIIEVDVDDKSLLEGFGDDDYLEKYSFGRSLF